MGSDKTDVAVAPTTTKKKSDDRFYLMTMRNREVRYGDIGGLIRLEGVVIGGGGAQAILMLPGSMLNERYANVSTMSIDDWSDWLQRSDNPEVLVGPSLTGPQGASLPKIWHRKIRYEISGAVQQKVWAMDGFQCVYCGARMGKVLMTIDHWQPLELGGKNDITNYLTSCKPCNKDKGSEDPVAWCGRRGKDYAQISGYLASRQ